ncbi:hypothetical protein CHUAL_010455 [Chamberlinius hualienensis]
MKLVGSWLYENFRRSSTSGGGYQTYGDGYKNTASGVVNSVTAIAMEPTVDIPRIVTIEWDMMDKHKFFPLSMASSFTIRCFLYPFTVIKTRIQIQRQKSVYSGTIDAFRKTFKSEGMAGLYKGFWINTIQIASGVFYVTTYENVRHIMAEKTSVKSNELRALVAGGCASLVGQTIIVPFDVISQHMMVLGQLENKRSVAKVVNPLSVNLAATNGSKLGLGMDITRKIYERDGLRGFYRGYYASLCTFVPNSALWWSFYHLYSDQLAAIFPNWVPVLTIQCVAAPISGITSSFLTNPLDVVRARLQIHMTGSFLKTFNILWKEEKLGIFTKGLSARLVQSVTFSVMIIMGYETIKRWSLREEYRHQIRR